MSITQQHSYFYTFHSLDSIIFHQAAPSLNLLVPPFSLSSYSLPGNVPLSKLNFAAKHDYEYISNFKVLQESFKRNRIDKVRRERERGKRFEISTSNQPKSNAQRSLDGKESRMATLLHIQSWVGSFNTSCLGTRGRQ